MKTRVSLIVLLALVAAILMFSGWGRTVGAAAQPTPAMVTDEPAAGQSGSPSGESQTPATGELEEFVPSERVPADSAISFPVDI